MADIAPLTPLRYDLNRLQGGLGRVVAPPYDVISPEERQALAARDPSNVVRLILPDGVGDAKYAHAAELLSAWRAEGVLIRDPQPAFYRYDQTFAPPGGGPSVTRRGFLALVRVVPFAERMVLPHERTLAGPKEDRLKLFRATRTNLSPGFMLYRDERGELDGPLRHADVLANFATEDGVNHVLAKVHDAEAVRAIVAGLARSTLLIADGHHRYETALRYSEEVSAAHAKSHASQAGPGARPGPRDTGEHRYFMTFLANGDDPNLLVFPTHRHVHSLPSFSFDALVRGAREYFAIEELPSGAGGASIVSALRRAAATGVAGVTRPAVAAAATDGRVVLMVLRPDADVEAHPTLGTRPPVLRKTDVTVLHAGILEHLLGITPEAQAAKTNLWYPQNAEKALGELRGGRGQVLFLMNATPVAQVREVAESGEVMPQKSTFFYPKVLTGLAIHTLDPERSVANG